MLKIKLSVFTLFGAVIFLFGCSNFESPNRYELVASTQGYVYRLDKKTGDVSVIEKDTMSKVSEGKIWRRQPDGTWSLSEGGVKDLVVGSLFRTEDGNIIRYIGKGNFEPGKPAGETVMFKEGDTTYNIPVDKVDAFQKAHPKAMRQIEIRTWEDLKKKRGW